MSDETAMPSGWCEVQLEDLVLNPKSDLVDGPFGSNLKSSEYVESGIPVLKIQNIKANRFVRKRLSYVTPKKAAELSRHSFVAGDLMITKLGEPLGLCCEVPADLEHGVFVADLMRLRPSAKIVESAFLLHAINSVVVQSQFKEITKGTTRQRVNLSIVRGIKLALPPLDEQRRIVGKVEELFSELDEGVANLKQARAQLAVYRQALLKHAFEGHLTAEWRTKHAPDLESADQFLARIRAGTEARYQRDLLQWNAETELWKLNPEAGMKPKKPRKPRVFAPILSEEAKALRSLPDGWLWVRLGELVHSTVGYAFESSAFSDEGIRLLRGDNIEPGRLRWDTTRYWPADKLEPYRDLIVTEGEIIVAMDRPVISSGLKVAIAKESDLPCLLVQRVTKLRHESGIHSGFLFHLINQQRFINHCLGTQTGTQLPHISESQIGDYLVPLCCAKEQEQIFVIVESATSTIDEQLRTLDESLQKAEALRQSILKKAFAGELVPQDPADEPAAALLARLRAEREKVCPPAAKRRRTSQSKSAPVGHHQSIST